MGRGCVTLTKVELNLRKTASEKRSGWMLLGFGPFSSSSESEYLDSKGSMEVAM